MTNVCTWSLAYVFMLNPLSCHVGSASHVFEIASVQIVMSCIRFPLQSPREAAHLDANPVASQFPV